MPVQVDFVVGLGVVSVAFSRCTRTKRRVVDIQSVVFRYRRDMEGGRERMGRGIGELWIGKVGAQHPVLVVEPS